jgi:hypothetical protein
MECRLEGARSAPSLSSEHDSMPFPFIPGALGVCFLLIWLFIGAMILRDGQLNVQADRDLEDSILPMPKRIPRRGAA